MQIKLREIPFYIMNLEEDADKRHFLSTQLSALGVNFTFVPAIRTQPGSVGTTLSHLKILKLPELRPPFVILEDDCSFNFNRIEMEFVLPDQTDGFYLGVSSFGVGEESDDGIRWGKLNNSKYEIYDPDYLKINSMLGLHALLYLSDQFQQAAIEANWKALLHYDYYIPGDMAVVNLLEKFFLLAPHEPWCYQSEFFRGNWGATKNSLLRSCIHP